MKNKNTQKFWDNKIKIEGKSIIRSSIYKDKINLISNLIRDNSKLLDVGIGYGYIEDKIYKQGKKIDAYGIDISKVAIHKLRKIYKNSNYKVGVAEKIPFTSNFFDYVLALDILEHIDRNKIKIVLNEIKRVAKKNASIIISVPVNESELDFKKNRHIIRYSLESITNELETVGIYVTKTFKLYAFNKFYTLKKLIVSHINIFNTKPNLLILVCKKKQ